jgi:AraC-like DNA-binding protein
LGEFVNLSALGLLAYLMMHCPTLGRALAKLCQYQDMACEGVQTRIEVDTQWCTIKLEVIHPDIIYPTYTIGSEMSMYVHAIPNLTSVPFLVKEVHFTFPQPIDTTEYQRVFQTQHLNFESSFNGLIFDKDLLQLPILNANPALFELFDKHAKEYINKLKNMDSITYRVKQEILQGLKGEEPKLTGIARNLGMSERSIQMKLKEEGFTFRQLLEDIRKEIAISHLCGYQSSTTDIAYLLGFSEPSVFSRSFKKWTGYSPGAYRLTQRVKV